MNENSLYLEAIEQLKKDSESDVFDTKLIDLFFGSDERYIEYYNTLFEFAQDAMPREIVECMVGAYYIGWKMRIIYEEKGKKREEMEKIDKLLG